ncbi:MAG: hypothetical protein WCG73_00765 [Candidatus Moraniibacteriota bacterium]
MIVTGLSLSAYFSVAFFNPGFLSYDLRQKYNALANDTVAITATVLDVPTKPVVSGASQCNSGVLSVELDWADDINTFTYDIVRDGLLLVTGISSSAYSDTNVTLLTTYEYVVTARGPMGPGFATGDPVSVTTLHTCGSGSVDPTVNIVSFDGQNIGSYVGTPSVTNRRPIFTGTTNIPNATIQVVVGPPSSFLAQFTANVNGYFSWQPPFDLSLGTQVFTVTVIDPNDSLRQTSSSLQFEIKESSSGGRSSNARHSNGSGNNIPLSTIEPVIPIVVPPVVPISVDFSLSVVNKEKKVFQGETLSLLLLIKDIGKEYQNANVPVRFSIVDVDGNMVTSSTSDELLYKGAAIQKTLDTPTYIKPGAYSVQAEILIGETNVSRLVAFTVMEVPLISLGGGAFVTYAEIVQNMGWIVLALLILLLLWIFMFMREYGLYLHALRHITEQHLMNAGFMTRRKGVIR